MKPANFMCLIPSPFPGKGNFSSFAPDSIFGVLREPVAWFAEALTMWFCQDHVEVSALLTPCFGLLPPLSRPPCGHKLWCLVGVFSHLGLEADQAFIPGPLTSPHRKFPRETENCPKWINKLWRWGKVPFSWAISLPQYSIIWVMMKWTEDMGSGNWSSSLGSDHKSWGCEPLTCLSLCS